MSGSPGRAGAVVPGVHVGVDASWPVAWCLRRHGRRPQPPQCWPDPTTRDHPRQERPL